MRVKNGKMDQIEGLKEERLARQKAKEVEERLRNIKKVRRRRRQIILGIIIALAVLGIASAIASNLLFSRNSVLNNPIEDGAVATEKAEDAKPTAIVIEGAAATETAGDKPVVNRDGYMEINKSGISFAYPNSFANDDGGEGTYLSLKDSMGDAKIAVYKDTASVKTETEAMKKYRDNNDLTVTQATTYGKSYLVIGTNGDKTYHSFGHVEDGMIFYYELIYPTASSKAESYEASAQYMDSFLKTKNYSGDEEQDKRDTDNTR